MRQAVEPSRMRRKRCRWCGELFDPDPRTMGRQRYCSTPACQTKRQRLNENAWRIRNPDCLERQREQSRQWHKARPQYSRERRFENPRLTQKNRAQTKLRMQKTRSQKVFDKSKVMLTELVDTQADKCYLTHGYRWLMVRLTKASPLSKLWFLGDNHSRLRRVANRLPRSHLYDVSEIL
jgi:hypothetical protein